MRVVYPDETVTVEKMKILCILFKFSNLKVDGTDEAHPKVTLALAEVAFATYFDEEDEAVCFRSAVAVAGRLGVFLEPPAESNTPDRQGE